MKLIPVDVNSYTRFESFKYYLNHEMSLNATLYVDFTRAVKIIKKNNLRTLPVIVWIISKAVNQTKAFRTTVNELGELCEFDVLNPGYVILNSETNAFSCISTPYVDDFRIFYENCIKDMNLVYSKKLFPMSTELKAVFSITTMPFLPFESFYVGLKKPPLTPVIATGQYSKRRGHYLLPVSIQVHHAFCDGYHLGVFYNAVQMIVNSFRY